MPLSQLVRLVDTLDGERRSPVADAVAAAWGYRPGVARHHRSSATHVFSVDGAYLRFVPDSCRSRDRVELVARLQARLGAVASPVLSTAGRLVEIVDTTACGLVHATVVVAAPGEQIDAGALAPGRAGAWGAGLARLHRDGPVEGPEWFAELARPAGFDPVLAGAVERLAARLAALPRDASRYGFVHGDYELDNIRWVGDAVTAYDLDEAGRSWFVADIASAVRDVGPGPARDAFVAGYREVRDLSTADLAPLPLFAAAHAAVWLTRLPGVLDAVESDGLDSGWLSDLRRRLNRHAGRQRAMVVDLPAEIR